MATISSVGITARNYATWQLWAAAWTTGGWVGQGYNDAEFITTSVIDLSSYAGMTSPSDFITMQTGPGQSFKNVNTNAIAYVAANGVGIRATGSIDSAINVGPTSYVTIQYLQIQQDGNYHLTIDFNAGSSSGNLVDSCISVQNGNGGPTMKMYGGVKCVNSALIQNFATSPGINLNYFGGTVLANVTLVAPSDTSNSAAALNTQGASTISIINCAWFGFASFNSTGGGTPTFTGSNNASDLAIGFGTSNQASKTYANQFVGTTTGAPNFQTKTAAALVNNGATDTTDIPASVDIFGTSRPQGTGWCIGCHELVASTPPASNDNQLPLLGVG